jgi:hypothetical protein
MGLSNVGVAMAQFTSKTSAAGVVNIMFGFKPDLVIMIRDLSAVSPDIRVWLDSGQLPLWTINSLLITGTTGVITKVASMFSTYAGGTKVTTAETTDSDPKHVDRAGTAHSGDGTITAEGIAVAAAAQTAGKVNIVLAFRADK